MKENKKPDNPSAFPLDANACLEEYKGMTLRDYFAAKAMQVYVNTKKDAPDGEDWDEWHAKNAYITADAMLKQREL
jgi:hypothetical protein